MWPQPSQSCCLHTREHHVLAFPRSIKIQSTLFHNVHSARTQMIFQFKYNSGKRKAAGQVPWGKKFFFKKKNRQGSGRKALRKGKLCCGLFVLSWRKKKTLPRLSTHQEWPQPFVWGKSERANHAELLGHSATSPESIQPQFWKGHAVNPHVVRWAD